MGLIKSLVRADLAWSNFYLGLDIALAAIANGVVNMVDMVGKHSTNAETISQNNAEYLVLSFALLLVTMVIHQRWEGTKLDPTIAHVVSGPSNRTRRGVWLGIVSNGLGTASLLVFMLFKLRGKL